MTNVKNPVIRRNQFARWGFASPRGARSRRLADRPLDRPSQPPGTLHAMRVIEVVRTPSRDQLDALLAFVVDVAEATGRQPLSDHLLLDLQSGGGDGFHAVRVAHDDGTIALAQISSANDGAILEVVVDPRASGDDERLALRDTAAENAVDAYRRSGGGRLAWWLDAPTEHDRAIAAELGLEPWRELYEMRRDLPHESRATVATRAFVPGSDDAEWVTVNNRAFADHGEQGGWTIDTLALRMGESWFDPDGFRIHEIDGRIAAFCWTKLHHELDPVVGEIYVIAVDPDFHGRGLGKQLTLAGLDAITDAGVGIANLYVDAGNTAAVGLYDGLGFHIHHARAAFAGTLEPLH